MVAIADLPEDAFTRLYSRLAPVGDCLEWQGPRLPAGYGVVPLGGPQMYAHRLSVLLDGRAIPPGFVVMHVCDNPPCANPKHLKVSTQADNRKDCAAKGRNPLNGNQSKTRCKRGHDLSEYGRFTGRGRQRVCTACEARRHRLRRKGRRSDETLIAPVGKVKT